MVVADATPVATDKRRASSSSRDSPSQLAAVPFQRMQSGRASASRRAADTSPSKPNWSDDLSEVEIWVTPSLAKWIDNRSLRGAAMRAVSGSATVFDDGAI